jgi:hypothetical protein
MRKGKRRETKKGQKVKKQKERWKIEGGVYLKKGKIVRKTE